MSVADLLKVMVVDDHVSSRMVTCEGLKAIGVKHLVAAKDGRDAYNKLNGSPVHLVITDLHMPDIDGYQLVKAIRSHPQLKNTGVIILTGKKDQTVVNNARNLGVNSVLSKPSSAFELKSAVEGIVGRLS